MTAPLSPPRRDAGFTLVELLVSLAVLALVAALVAQGLGSHRRALLAIEGRTEEGEGISWAQNEIRRGLENLLPRAAFTGPTPTLDFRGGPERLEFVTLVPDAAGANRLRRVRLDVSGGDLELASSPPDGPPRFGDMRILARGVGGLRVRYYGLTSAPGSLGPEAWSDQWAGSSTPPRLVSVAVTFPAGDRRFWPALLVRPTANVDDACVPNGETGGCRGRS